MTVDEMKECRWLKRELVAQIEFTEGTPDGHFKTCEVYRAAGRYRGAGINLIYLRVYQLPLETRVHQ